MKNKQIFQLVAEFCQETHGRTDFDKDQFFVMGGEQNQFAPLRFLQKKDPSIEDVNSLLRMGFIYSAYDHVDTENFKKWYEGQFQKKLTSKVARNAQVIYCPDQVSVFNALEVIFKNYEVLRQQNIILNGKNLPVQVGEWYAKGIFGLTQLKSTSQRGFDFFIDDKRVEVKVHWSDLSTPKGIKIKRTSVELTDYCILMYISSNFMIREICFLDSDFILRKFAGKGHTIFLKEADISTYFFSKSDKQFSKVVNKDALMKFSSPQLAMKLSGRI